ncbi:MAG: DUF885 family protein [Candidatus Eisenbacteria bacterium]
MSAAIWACLICLGPVSASARASAPTSIAALDRAYAEHLLVSRPDRGSREGVKGAADRLTPVTETSLERDRAWLGAFRARLDLVDRNRLSNVTKARLDTLRARTTQQWEESRPDGPFRRDALAYRALTDQAVLEVITARRVGDCERVRRATARLRMLPEVLRAAAINLRGAPYDDARVRRGVEDAVRTLRVEVTAAAAACRDARRIADFVEADSTAIRAFRIFPGRLHDGPEKPDSRFTHH